MFPLDDFFEVSAFAFLWILFFLLRIFYFDLRCEHLLVCHPNSSQNAWCGWLQLPDSIHFNTICSKPFPTGSETISLQISKTLFPCNSVISLNYESLHPSIHQSIYIYLYLNYFVQVYTYLAVPYLCVCVYVCICIYVFISIYTVYLSLSIHIIQISLSIYLYIYIYIICLSKYTVYQNLYPSISIYIYLHLSPSTIMFCEHLMCMAYGILKDPAELSHLSLEGLRCRRAHRDVKASSVGRGYHLKRQQRIPTCSNSLDVLWHGTWRIDVMLLCLLFDTIELSINYIS